MRVTLLAFAHASGRANCGSVPCSDHGPLNSWDRQPFAMAPGALPVPAMTDISRNFIFADYEGVKALDHDDGSS